jgi:sialate O-acetylesterase
MKKLVYSLLFFFISAAASADVRLPNIFGDNMVLQRDRPIMIWGWANPGEKVTVQLDKQSKKVTAGKDGKWKLSLNAMPAGGPFQLTVKGKNTISLNNVVIGEVWICSGQSNMEWRVQNSNNPEVEIASANYPQIRHIKVPNTIAGAPMDDIGEAHWTICSPETVGSFTAVGYFFARQLQEEINVPIGLINTSWGGTHIETWTSREAFEESDEFRSLIASMKTLNLDSIRRQNEQVIIRKIEKLQGPIRKSDQSVAAWKDLKFDDSAWPTMQIPALWERRALGNMDGVVWFRKIVTLDGGETSKDAVLHLGAIDDADETYVNGVKVGSTNDYSIKRSYTIQPGLLKEGTNVIAVRVEDTGGGGGIYGESDDLHISFGNTKVPLAGSWSYQVESLLRTNGDVSPNQFPTLLFNAMINPLIPYSIRGALWYQGESNAGRAYQYRKAFPLMIKDWRKRWGQGDFPFYFVQLATFNANNGNSNNGSRWAELREAQAMTLSLPNTGMAVTTDVGDPKDIHPRNKQDVGKRLAALALRDIYGKNIVAGGPTFVSLQRNGNKVILTFANIGSGLMVKDKYGYIKGFEISGSDKKFVYAQAHLDGNNVVVYHKDIAEPVAVRFGWADDASDCNLFNKEGFPAAPFRTDDWKGLTAENRFNFVYPQ